MYFKKPHTKQPSWELCGKAPLPYPPSHHLPSSMLTESRFYFKKILWEIGLFPPETSGRIHAGMVMGPRSDQCKTMINLLECFLFNQKQQTRLKETLWWLLLPSSTPPLKTNMMPGPAGVPLWPGGCEWPACRGEQGRNAKRSQVLDDTVELPGLS